MIADIIQKLQYNSTVYWVAYRGSVAPHWKVWPAQGISPLGNSIRSCAISSKFYQNPRNFVQLRTFSVLVPKS